jgi:hypothetical protein
VIENTIDLRYPDVRAWFHNAFNFTGAIPSKKSIVAYSRFHLEYSLPTTPSSFWDMLPTMMNPDIGGGASGSTGSSLTYIGNWMRRNHVGAMIYPSARFDVYVSFNKGEMKEFSGWNLILYQDAPLFPHRGFFESSINQWAYLDLPEGVNLVVTDEDSKHFGSFKVEGLEKYHENDYLVRANSLRIARTKYGHEGDTETASKQVALRMWQISILTIRWLRLLLNKTRIKEVETILFELQGLAIPFELYEVVGRIGELNTAISLKKCGYSYAIQESGKVANNVARDLAIRYPSTGLDYLVYAGNFIEFCLFFLEAANFNVPLDADVFIQAASADMSNLQLKNNQWFDRSMASRIEAFSSEFKTSISRAIANSTKLIAEGETLTKQVYCSFIK